MKNMITDEFIRYKSGFIIGKQQAIEMYKMGIRTDLNSDNKDKWSSYGFQDGFDYYFDQLNNGISFETINTKEIIETLFYERVMKENENSDIVIPVSKFRM